MRLRHRGRVDQPADQHFLKINIRRGCRILVECGGQRRQISQEPAIEGNEFLAAWQLTPGYIDQPVTRLSDGSLGFAFRTWREPRPIVEALQYVPHEVAVQCWLRYRRRAGERLVAPGDELADKGAVRSCAD